MKDLMWLTMIIIILTTQFILFGFMAEDPNFTQGRPGSPTLLNDTDSNFTQYFNPEDSDSGFSAIDGIKALFGFGLQSAGLPKQMASIISVINWFILLMLGIIVYRLVRSGAG